MSGRLIRRHSKTTLTIRTYPTFATEWLSGRLPAFCTEHPDIGMSFSAESRSADLDLDEIDVAIIAEPGGKEGLAYDLLMHAHFTPVVRPDLLPSQPRPSSPGDLRQLRLLYAPTEEFIWNRWFNAHAEPAEAARNFLRFENASLTYQAARNGAGVAMANVFLVAEELAAGTLVAPFPLSVQALPPYWLVSRKARSDEPKIQAFRDWLLNEVQLSNLAYAPVLCTFRSDTQ